MDLFDHFETFNHDGPLTKGRRTQHEVYVGGQGKPILLIQELPGLEGRTAELAQRLIADGYRVYMPHLLGPLGQKSMLGNVARMFCMWKEFNAFAKEQSSPIVNWLRDLCHEISKRNDGAGIGVIGMCLTGNFALALMAEAPVLGAVASQPSLPVGPSKVQQAALHMSADEVTESRAAMAQKGHAVAMRYDGDTLCRAARLEAIEAAFAPHIMTHTFEGDGHSLLTHDLNDEAYQVVSTYFSERLG